MADEKKKMQADGERTRMQPPDDKGELASRRGGDEQKGESGGGPYPNPHSRKRDAAPPGDFKGGQSNQAYYGKGQLGEADDIGETPNAPSKES